MCCCVCTDWYNGTVTQTNRYTHTSLHSPVVHSKQLSTNKHINIYYGKKFIYD